MTGPRMGRAFGAAGSALAAYVVLQVLLDGPSAPAAVTLPALVAAVCWIARLALWSALWHPPAPVPVDPSARDAAEAALATTEVAVVCDGDSMVAARTAVIAAIASVGDADRVLVVGADPRLGGLADSLRVRHVACGIGVRSGIEAAVGAAGGSHLVLTPASAALLPGALRPALELFDETTVWVQAEQHAPTDRTLVDHVRAAHWWPALDAQDATPWLGLDSIVAVEAFRSLPVADGPAAVTVAAQRADRRGRWVRSMLAVEQGDGRRDPRVETDARAGRLRTVVARRTPVLDRGLSTPQRLAHGALLLDDVLGLTALVAVGSVTGALVTGTTPVPLDRTLAFVAGAVVLGWIARALLTRGLVRPFALCRAATDDIPVAVRSLFRALRPARAGRVPVVRGARPTGWRAHAGRLALVAVVDAALVRHGWRVLRSDDPVSRVDVALFVAGAVVITTLLASARVLRRRRTLRGSRRLPVAVAATIGTWQGRVLDLSASGLRAEFGAPVELLAEVPVRLHARGVQPVDVQAQVVRVDERESTWILGLRLSGGTASGAHDEYLALWLTQMAGAAEERPRRVDDPVLGRRPVQAGGAPLIRLLTAAAMLLVGVAVLPVGAGTGAAAGSSDHATDHAIADGADEAVDEATHGSEDDEAATGSTGELLPVVVAPQEELDAEDAEDAVAGEAGEAGEAGAAATTSSTSAPSEESDASGGSAEAEEPLTDRPSASAAGLQIVATVDDEDRAVEGGQLLAHTIEITNTGSEAVAAADVVVAPAAGVVDPTSLTGTCAGSDAGAIDSGVAAEVAAGVRWRLFEATPLEPEASCTIGWRVTLPAATSLDDGERLATEVDVPIVRVVGGDDTAGPAVIDEVVVRRPTLRLSLTAGGGTTLDQMTIGVPFTWVLAVENVSSAPASAYGIDLVQNLPTHWTYTSTVSVQPSRCDVAPVVLVDDTAGTQTVTWSDACDLAMGERMEIVFTATAQPDAAADPGVVDDAGDRIAHVSEVTLTAEDAAGNPLGSAGARAGAVPRTVDLAVRLTDAGADDAPADASPAAFVGGFGRYRIDVANDGADATSDAVVATLELPGGIVPIGANGERWTCDLATPVVCTLDGTIAPDDTAPPVVITVVLAAEALGDDGADEDPNRTMVNARVSVSGGGIDLDTEDDIDDETTLVRAAGDSSGPPSADLTVTAVTGGRILEAGAPVAYEVLVTNQGPTDEPGTVVVRADVAPGLLVDTVSGTGWSCEVTRDDSAASWSCEFEGPVPVGTLLAPITVSGSFTGAAADGGGTGGEVPLAQPVSVTGTTPAGIDEATTEVSWTTVPAASLGLVVRQAFLEDDEAAAESAATADDGWRVGTSGLVRLVVVNDGPSGEHGPIEIAVPTPDGAQIVEAGGNGWACDAPSDDGAVPTWTCRLDRSSVADDEPLVAVGESAPPLTVSVVFVADGSATFEATVTGTTDDDTHRERATFEIGRRVNASLELAMLDEVRAGEPVWLTVAAVNDGPSDGVDPVEIAVTLPEGWSAVGVDDADWACRTADASASSVTCVRERPLLARETASFGIETRVPSEAESGDVEVAAVLSSDVDEQEPADDTDVAEMYVWGAGATERPADTSTTVDDHAHTEDPTSLAVGDLAGYGGAAGAFAFAVLLLSGRRRPGW